MPAPFERLKVWQLAHNLTLQVYKITGKFPTSETYGLTAQLRRSAVAVGANIVEGNTRIHKREYIQFCNIAKSSAEEAKYLLRLSKDLQFLGPEDCEPVFNGYDHLGALLYSMMNKLNRRTG